jgi:hypothetical protein
MNKIIFILIYIPVIQQKNPVQTNTMKIFIRCSIQYKRYGVQYEKVILFTY